MKEFWTMTRVCFSAIGGWLGYFLGGCDNLMIALIVFVAADYVTGVMCAIKGGNKLSRSAINHMIEKYAKITRVKSPLIPAKVTPHTFRHTKAMHLCQAGVDMIYIRDILGHVSLETTNSLNIIAYSSTSV